MKEGKVVVKCGDCGMGCVRKVDVVHWGLSCTVVGLDVVTVLFFKVV